MIISFRPVILPFCFSLLSVTVGIYLSKEVPSALLPIIRLMAHLDLHKNPDYRKKMQKKKLTILHQGSLITKAEKCQ